MSKRTSGSGTLSQHGYVVHGEGERKLYEHILVVERILGKKLPPGAVVHHVDENGYNNAPTNLVVCPDKAYHALLHRRMRALDACGNANYSRCWMCKTWDDPANMTVKKGRPEAFHAACWAKRAREDRIKKRNEKARTK